MKVLLRLVRNMLKLARYSKMIKRNELNEEFKMVHANVIGERILTFMRLTQTSFKRAPIYGRSLLVTDIWRARNFLKKMKRGRFLSPTEIL